MPTVTQNKIKKTKSSSKDMLAFFDSHGTTPEEIPKPKKEVKVSSKKNTKQEAVTEEKEVLGEKSSIQEVEIPTAKKNDKAEAVKKIQTSSIAASDTSKTEKKTSALGSFFGKEDNQEKKKEVKEEDSESTKKKEEKSTKPSLFGRLFGSRSKTKEQEVSEAKNRSAEKVIISEPVKATPIPQRKLANQSKLSTFGLSKERDQFIENLSMLVLSGMSIVSAISSIIKQTKSSGMKLILERMLAEIEAGSTIWKAFDRTEFFKGYTISLIRLGEESGNFAENLKVVALEEEKDREFKSKVRSALMYPIFVLGLTAIIGIGISWFILPKLSKIFYDLKLTLPFITKVLLAFGVFLSKHGMLIWDAKGSSFTPYPSRYHNSMVVDLM
jgi:hypothetical protein